MSLSIGRVLNIAQGGETGRKGETIMRRVMVAACLLAVAEVPVQAQTITRYPPLAPDAMTPEQKAMYDSIMAGPRHSIEGPFNAWLRSPVLGDRLQRVGEYLRFNTTIPHNLTSSPSSSPQSSGTAASNGTRITRSP